MRRRQQNAVAQLARQGGGAVERVFEESRGSYCEQTGKRQFSSKHAARAGMRGLKASLRVYRCEHCRDFHLTSQRYA